MNTSGKRLIASFVKLVMEMAWWAVAIGLGLLVIRPAVSALSRNSTNAKQA